MATLNKDTRRQLIDAIRSAYSSHSDLQQMLSLQMDLNLWDISSHADTLKTSVFNLVEWAESHGKVDDLVEAAHQGNPGNPDMYRFFEEVWPRYATHSTSIPHYIDAVCGIAPVRSALEDVHRAFGWPDLEEQSSPTKIITEYVSGGVRVTCLLRSDRRWIVDMIKLQAPFSKSLSFSDVHIGMTLDELKRACIGKYHLDPRDPKRRSFVLEPIQDGNGQLTIVLDADRVTTILMQRRA